MIKYIKRASKTLAAADPEIQRAVDTIVAEIEKRGEEAVCAYAAQFDRWTGPIVLSNADIERAAACVPDSVKHDIDFATERVRQFAMAQRKSMCEFSSHLSSGVEWGQRLIPVRVAGCYVPGGRYAHIAS